MKALYRVNKILKDNKINLYNYSSVENIPISIKLEIVEDLLKHTDDSGLGFPTYSGRNLRSKLAGLILAYNDAIFNSPGAWLKFIKLSEEMGNIILKDYFESNTFRRETDGESTV